MAAWLGAAGCGGIPEVGDGSSPSDTTEPDARAIASPVVVTQPRFAFCGTEEHPVVVATSDPSELEEPQVDAGFFDIEPFEYEYFDANTVSWERRAVAATKLFYSFVPADDAPKGAPLFLFFNGGPGAATTGNLRIHGTAPKTIDSATGAIADNPASWSKLGNLFYVDSRDVGFSYSPEWASPPVVVSEAESKKRQDVVDAMDYVRALLALYERYPALSDNPLVVVGESYGGVRAQLILNALRHPEELGVKGDLQYVDSALSKALKVHASSAAKRRADAGMPQRDPAEQFSWQVLIQPAIVATLPYGYWPLADQFGHISALRPTLSSLEEWIGADGAIDYDVYKVDQTRADREASDAHAYSRLLTPDGFESLLGVAPQSVTGLSAALRRGVIRSDQPMDSLNGAAGPTCPSTSEEWFDTLGTLEPRDCYYMPFHPIGATGESAWRYGWQNGKLFLRNLRGVHTFVTRALLDSAVIADFIPLALSTYFPDVYSENPVDKASGDAAIANIDVQSAPISGTSRAGHIDITYRNSEDGSMPPTRRIRFPTYRNAGHMVAQDSPKELFDDVKEFLCAPETP